MNYVFPNFFSFSLGAACNSWATWFTNTIGQFYKLFGFVPPNFPSQICGFLNISNSIPFFGS